MKLVLGEESKRKIVQILLSDNTVKRLIDKLALHIKNQLIYKLQNSVFFVIQCDESIDVSLIHYPFIKE